MEGRFVVTALLFTILAACSKQEINVQSFQTTPSEATAQVKPSIYISGWETVPFWNATTNRDGINFSYIRQLPELKEIAKDGAVLVFARNLWTDDAVSKEIDDGAEKPLMMPFYFLPYLENPNYTEQWSYNAGEDKINVSLVIKGGKNAVPSKKVQLMFVLIPGKLLKEKKQTTQALHKLSYNQIVQTFGLPS
jgi:hypothetical protein